jgi:GT2 family glycosyltransferase
MVLTMNRRTAIVIATRNRPNDIAKLLSALALQTERPDLIVVSACSSDDIGEIDVAEANVKIIFGAPGSAVQRNRALSAVGAGFDIVIFFDDDFVPSRFWVERIRKFFSVQPEIICVTGQVLRDGVLTGMLSWPEGCFLVENADLSTQTKGASYTILEREFPYGCNMAFRANSIEKIVFDERLVLYGWLEDRDFAYRAVGKGKMVWTDAVWGVHLGTTGGRSSGVPFGYSQVVNPWYLMKKGTMRPVDGLRNIFRGLIGNALGIFFWNSQIDRWGRLKGNAIGICDIVRGRWAPERAAEF